MRYWFSGLAVVILILLFSVVLIKSINRRISEEKKNIIQTSCCGKVQIEVIDGCEYISLGSSLTHKGNCTNSIHVYNKEVR